MHFAILPTALFSVSTCRALRVQEILEGWEHPAENHLLNQGRRVPVALHLLLAVNPEKPAAHLPTCQLLLTQHWLHRAPLLSRSPDYC